MFSGFDKDGVKKELKWGKSLRLGGWIEVWKWGRPHDGSSAAHPNPPSPTLTHPSALPTTFPPPSTLASLTYTYVHKFCRAIFRRHHDQQCFWVLSCKVGVVVWVRGGFAWQWQDSPPPATARPPPPPPPWYLNLPTTAEGQLKEKCIHQLKIWRLNLLRHDDSHDQHDRHDMLDKKVNKGSC